MAGSLKPFHLMTPEDYAEIGLMCGLEVHQQLLTRRKLFCRCPAGRYSGAYDAEILRHMRPTLSELGEYDGTALMEKKTKKNIFYRIHRDTVCTYEMDDTPPFFMDDEAVDTALELSLLLRLTLVGELHVARKQYLDGSIPTGFQRTTILGVDGWIPFGDRRIRIAQLGLEEDSCREVADVGHDRVYLTDRLGMPLIEVVTYPDMKTPEETAAVGQIIRKLCRSTGRVRTGYGAARQDVNVSVRGGTRIEIKGVPRITKIPHLIYNEAMRQCSLLRIRDELHRRGVTADTLDVTWRDVTRVVANTPYEPIRRALNAGQCVKGVVLRGFAGLLNEQTQEHTSFSREFSDRIRVIACLTQLPNMVHSDTASESLSGRHWKEIRRKIRAEHTDALILVWGSEGDTETACSEIAIRAREATIGIPSDTRQALKDGTNGFERVLPGPERMYPDTDLPPVAITQDRKRRIQDRLPEYFWDREVKYREMGLPEDTIGILSTSPRVRLFERIVEQIEVDPVFVAVVLVQRFKAWRREGFDPAGLADEEIFETFKAFAEGGLTREGLLNVLELFLSQGPLKNDQVPRDRVAAAIRTLNMQPMDDEAARSLLMQMLKKVDTSQFPTPERLHRFLMGRLMHEMYGRLNAGRVAEELALALEKGQSSETARV